MFASANINIAAANIVCYAAASGINMRYARAAGINEGKLIKSWLGLQEAEGQPANI